MRLSQTYRIIFPVLINNFYLLIKIIFSLINGFIKLTFEKRLIFLQNKLKIYIGISEEVLGQKQDGYSNSTRVLDSQYRLRQSFSHAGIAGHLESDIKNTEENFIKAGDVNIKTLKSFGLENLPFTFIGSEITKSIGHMAQCLSLRQKIIEVEGETNHRYLITSSVSANKNYLSYWYKYFPNFELNYKTESIIEKEMWPFFGSVSTVRVKDKEIYLNRAHDIYSKSWEKLNKEPLLQLSDSDKEFGYKFLNEYGFEKISNGKFVTIHVRNAKTWINGKLLAKSYGRNADIRTYGKSINYLLDLGYFVVRIGDKDEFSFPTRPKFIDYTKSKYDNDRLNTFFLSECDFLIGTNSGPICVPSTFGKRVIMTNTPSIAMTSYFTNSIMIPKLVMDGSKCLSLEEMKEFEVGWATDDYVKKVPGRNLEWRDNSEEEIFEAVLELIQNSVVIKSAEQDKFELRLRNLGSIATSNISNSFINRWGDKLL